MRHDVSIETAKAVPALIGATFAGLTLNEWVAIATLLYIILQAVYLVWKWRKQIKEGKKNDN